MKKIIPFLMFLLLGIGGTMQAQRTHEIKYVANLGYPGFLPYGVGYETQLMGRFNIAPSVSFFRKNHKFDGAAPLLESDLIATLPLRYYLPIRKGKVWKMKLFFSTHLEFTHSQLSTEDFFGRERFFAGGLGLGLKSSFGPVLKELFAAGTVLGKIWKYQDAFWLTEPIKDSELLPLPFPLTIGASIGYRIR